MNQFIPDTSGHSLVNSGLGYADESFGPAATRQRDFADKTEWRGGHV